MPDFRFENAAHDQGWARIAGVDEAGRGPLAGPVVAAAVVLNPDAMTEPAWVRLDDSKRMKDKARNMLFDKIMTSADIGVGIVDLEAIENLNILGATMKAMADAVAALNICPDHVLIDGNQMPSLSCSAETIVKGDGKSLSIAAASVIAKVTRDRIMADLNIRYPGYGWDRNAGYGTAEHLDALKRLGVTPHHRKSFAPVRKILSPEDS